MINPMMQNLMNQFGGPQELQRRMNEVQNNLSQMNITPEQYLNQQLQNGQLSKERLNWAIQQANMCMGRG